MWGNAKVSDDENVPQLTYLEIGPVSAPKSSQMQHPHQAVAKHDLRHDLNFKTSFTFCRAKHKAPETVTRLFAF